MNVNVPGFEVYCMAIISMEEADRLTYAGTPPSLRVEPTATQNAFPNFKVHVCHMMFHVSVITATNEYVFQTQLKYFSLFSEETSLTVIYTHVWPWAGMMCSGTL